MPLNPASADESLWAAATQPTAGVHAVIVGISDYPYLEDGSAPPNARAPNNGGLKQLEVSALTAARVFAWINEAGEIAGAPVATCRLLLAPRAAERAEVDGLTAGHYAAADFASIRAALEAWGDCIYAGGGAAGTNIAFFFFSGHGVEHLASPALLAQDILNPRAAGGANKAIALESLSRAVKTFGIDRGLFLVDACRDAPTLAMTLNIVGEDILKPNAYPTKRPDALLSLQSTSSGAKAYQVPGEPATIFGQAVLEALDGQPPGYAPYDTTADPWRLLFGNLESHVKQRVRELLARHSALKIQPVEPYGNPYNPEMLVAQRRRPAIVTEEAHRPPPIVVEPSLSGSALNDLIATRSADLLRGFTTLAAGDVGHFRAGVQPGTGFPGDLRDGGVMHQIFRHESVTDPWVESLQIVDADSEQPVPADTVRLSEGRSQEVDESLTAWIDVEVAPGPGSAVWISAGGRAGEPSCAVVIARDLKFPVPVRLDVGYRRREGSTWMFDSLSARLSEPRGLPPDVASIWQSLWRIQRLETLSDLGRAGIAAGEFLELKNTLLEKRILPLAAAVASTVLLRGNALDHLHDWPRNLANWFEWLPDGPILWAETLLRRHERNQAGQPAARPPGERPARRSAAPDDAMQRLAKEPAYREARTFFAKLADRGPPLLAASLAMAARQLPLWRSMLEAKIVPASDRPALAEACGVVERTTSHAVSSGLFAGFVSAAGPLTPREVLGRRRKAKMPRRQ